jgi:hypothetical protein
LFSKDGKSLFAGKSIEIVDIHKLREDMGAKTVAIDACRCLLYAHGRTPARLGALAAWG